MRLLTLFTVLTASAALAGEQKRLTRLPNTEGFAGSFAGVSHGRLIVAGGANFPDKKPWEGGKKKWYDTIYMLDQPDGKWKIAGKLPRPLGYGVCVTHRESVICVGGSDADRQGRDGKGANRMRNAVLGVQRPQTDRQDRQEYNGQTQLAEPVPGPIMRPRRWLCRRPNGRRTGRCGVEEWRLGGTLVWH
mgnify:CR=1 FL=1